MNIFVGNLLFEAIGADVKKLFEGFGNVSSVVIAMNKEKNTPKSRGFGFVQMPDGAQALAAIAALNGKKFMGRLLKVNPARPKGQKAMVWPPIRQRTMVWPPLAKAIAKAKTEVQRDDELKEKRQPKFEAGAEQYSREETEQKKTWFSPVFNKPGTYRGGRRTRSYMSRRGLAGMQEETKPRRRSQDNPMRWRKKGDQPKPWQRIPGEHKPWEKPKEGARPWKKAEGEPKPWRKSEGGFKPRRKASGESKPWKKAEGEPKPWRKSEGGIKPWKKPAGDAKPWGRSTGELKPLKRKEGEFKPWRKSAGEFKPRRRKSKKRPRQSRIESRRKPGGYTR